MAHFAKVNSDNLVEEVIVIPNEFETEGELFINETLKLEGKWVQTSYNAKFRGKFAGIGDIYDEAKDEFYTPITEVVDESIAE